uniref:Uncharacterized protein n=1 Tax=Rhipicephalus microplus TaxID=6941 RepID=A0A6G5A1B5_RHIMP
MIFLFYWNSYYNKVCIALLILRPNLRFCSILQNVRGKDKPLSSLLMLSTTQSVYSDTHQGPMLLKFAHRSCFPQISGLARRHIKGR